MSQALFDSIERMIVAAAEAVRPPERLTVAEAAVKYRFVNNPGSYVGQWDNDIAPYLVEPMELMTSTAFTGGVFVGPAQCGKTELFINWLTHTVICDPADMMLIQTSQTTARDFSMRRVDRLHRHSRDVGSRVIVSRTTDNVFDKRYISGMILTLSYPSINELSGRPVPRLWLTDYDRMSQDVDGEGSPFDLARKRATTFRSNGMTYAESSPGFEVEDVRWIRKSPHEAPPTQGILALYNRGDRRRWYWRCVSCQYAFEPDFNLLNIPKSADPVDAAEATTLVCPTCGQIYEHSFNERTGVPGKNQLNKQGRWLADGQVWRPSGIVEGVPARSDIFSHWLKGVAAAFTDWKTLALNYLKAKAEFERTGNQEALKTTVTTDQGNPYVPEGLAAERTPEDLKGRAVELQQNEVPLGVLFLVATIDVQRHRFVVQVQGVGAGGDIWVLDRFDIIKSTRLDADGDRAWVAPGSYWEDWTLLIDLVIKRAYPLSDGSGRQMAIKIVLCDSGGAEGVTANAYEFWRFLRDGPASGEEDKFPSWSPNLHRRFFLLRGQPAVGAPRVALTYPDAERKDRKAGARGEIPVLSLNSNLLKDQLNGSLDRLEPGGGRIVFPRWLGDTFYKELCVEIRDPKKGWVNPRNYRNESWDLLAYCIAACIHLHVDMWDWGAVTESWALPWDRNALVFRPDSGPKPFDHQKQEGYDLERLAEDLT